MINKIEHNGEEDILDTLQEIIDKTNEIVDWINSQD